MTDDKTAIRNVIATWMEATKAGDSATVLSLMTDDVVFMVPGHDPFGKKEFAESLKHMTGMKIDGKSEIKEIDVAGDWAWVRSQLQVDVTMLDGKQARRAGYTLSIFKKSNGKWQLARDANLLTNKT